ncbi:hypothetical protein ACHHYP_14897 [Achlya hypogyna]|uniref:Uncharacterized protein n=1 Tax=Achlya hypogyna TaxID=1202772 RepID=A0A1V9YC03_ACHHY|nr:hypothetical protein ACHHYP_14897 [Achlya hypogyna]
MAGPTTRFSYHLPLVYGAAARSIPTPTEQQNRLQALWVAEAGRDSDERVESSTAASLPRKLHSKAAIYLAENRRIDQLRRQKLPQLKKYVSSHRQAHPFPTGRRKSRHESWTTCLHSSIGTARYYAPTLRNSPCASQSAKIVQKAWRRYSQKQFWATYFSYVRASVQIQRTMRGVLARKLVRVWYLSQLRFVSKIQATYRSFLYQRVLATKFRWEHYNATVIQRYTRGCFGRRRAITVRRHIAALHIQMLWRGVVSRRRSDRLWLARKATVVQKHMRRFLAQRQTQAQRAAFHTAAAQIQRIFRGMRARMRIDEMLYDRETQNRKLVMDVLDAELLWYKEHVEKLQRRVDKSKLEAIVLQMEAEHRRTHIRVNDLECIYLDMQEQRIKMSPRAITDGWLYEMDAKIKAQRALITAAKLDAVFGHGYRYRLSVDKLFTLRRWRDDAIARRDELERWRVEEFLDYWERDMHHQAVLRARQRQQNIAHERRKWKVKQYTKEGKVLLAPPSRPSHVFCIGTSNLLAFAKQYQAEKSAVTTLTEQVALVSSAAQVEQATAMLRPLLDTFTHTYNGVHRALKQAPKPIQASQTLEPHPTTDAALERRETARTEAPLKRSPKKKTQRKATKDASVPWALLDQLAAERRKLQTEKALYAAFQKRAPPQS